MRLFQKNLRIFLRNKHIFIVALLGFTGLVLYLLYKCYTFTMNWDVTYYLLDTQVCCLPCFIIFSYLSYEYIYHAQSCGIEECAAAHKNGKCRLYSGLFCLLMLLPLLAFLIMTLFNFGIAFFGGQVADPNYYMHIVLVNFLNTFLLGLLSILTGGCLALRFRRVGAYSLMALAIFIISPVSDMIPGIATDSYGFNLWPLKRVFSKILPPNLTWVILEQYGISNETLRWNLMLFWIFLFLAILILAMTSRRTKKRVIAVCLAVVLAGANLYGYLLGGSDITIGPYPDSISRLDKEYYREHGQKEKPAAFTVASYDMDFSVYRELEGKVKMELGTPSPDHTYDFTLYRGYRILDVTGRDGQALAYTRDGDYFTVTSKTPLPVITVRYKGYSPSLYSNNQAALLPGCFPYYPMAGFHKFSNGGQGYRPVTNGFRSKYTVQVDSIREFFSNLKKNGNGKNSFSGESDAATLMSGLLTEETVDGFHMYRLSVDGYMSPTLNSYYLSKIQDEITTIENEKQLSNHLDLKDYKIFQGATGFARFAQYGIAVLLDDHVFIMGGDPELWPRKIAETLVKENNNA